jgi:predicted nucleic acid-binding protein
LTLVVDASVALAWVLPGEATPRTNELHERVKEEGAIASHLWRLEVANIVLQSERAQRITGADTVRIMGILGSLPIAIDIAGVDQAFSSVVELARTHGLTTYDASYLEVAMRLAYPLATDDEDLRAAAQAVGVELL